MVGLPPSSTPPCGVARKASEEAAAAAAAVPVTAELSVADIARLFACLSGYIVGYSVLSPLTAVSLARLVVETSAPP